MEEWTGTKKVKRRKEGILGFLAVETEYGIKLKNVKKNRAYYYEI